MPRLGAIFIFSISSLALRSYHSWHVFPSRSLLAYGYDRRVSFCCSFLQVFLQIRVDAPSSGEEEGRDLCLTFETDEQKLRGAITFEKEMPSSAYSSFQTAEPLNLNSKSSHYLCFQKKCLI